MAASTPPSTRPWPAPGASRRTSRTCTTSPCAPSWAGSSARPSSPRRAVRCWWPTTTRSSCAASPTWPRIPASSTASSQVVTSTPRRHRGSSASRPLTSASRCGRRPRWCRTAWRTGWSPTGWPSASASPSRRLRPSSTPTSWPSRPCRRTWSGRWPRRGSAGTPRRCSVDAVRSLSWPRRTSASARPASARP